ncbi:aldo/keto reductase [Micrococcus sp.]|uniref:aldo/keto reductase n=1 Tax=Micrococcus sp. TaxID=1271 RepID=UPI002A90F458|nr:aldo/keto reductase [Micrococcus sp.]MDY6055776.1 aldo/keto reductase [Micrococcus sp.]
MTTPPPAANTPAPQQPLILGTMGWTDPDRARAALHASLEAGMRVLDTADIYGAGASERTVGALLAELDAESRAGLRVQTKAGIVLDELDAAGRPEVRYDSSPAHLRAALERSLDRLGADCVDILLVHRPDVLTPVARTVRAFLDAREAGLVRRLGVSNLGTGRVLEFQRELARQGRDGTGLACVQMELGLHHRTLVEAFVLPNHPTAPATAGAADLGAVCAGEGIELQAWGPLGQGRFSTAPPAPDALVPDPEGGAATLGGTAAVVAQVAQELAVGPEAVVLAWLLKLPWQVRPVVGTQRPERIAACAQAPDAAARMSARQWYRLWTAARGHALP